MADPVGLIALGIEACKLLVEYVSAAKDLDSETSWALQAVRSLSHSLHMLHEIVSNSGFETLPSAQLVKERILSREGGLRKLNEQVDKCRSTAAPEKIARKIQQMKFPFRKGGLQSLGDHVSALRNDLQLAINVFQSGQAKQVLEYLGRLENSGHLTHSQNFQMQATMHDIQTTLTPRHDDRHRLQNDLAARISAETDRTGPDDIDDHDVEDIVREPLQRDRRCTCRGHRETRRWSIFGVLQLTTETISKHEPPCPRFGMTIRHTQYSTGFTPFRLWNTAGIFTALHIIRVAGASTPSIALRCRRVIPDAHPAIKALSGCGMGDRDVFYVGSSVDSDRSLADIRLNIDAMLRRGEVSAKDVTETGRTLFQQACWWIEARCNGDGPLDISDGLLLLRDLVEAGADINEIGWYGRTPLQQDLQSLFPVFPGSREPGGIRLHIELLALKADSDTTAAGWTNPLIHDMFLQSTELHVRFGFSDLLDAVYARSTKRLAIQLAAFPESVNEVLPGNETVLNAAVGWSEGLVILLRYCVKQACSRNIEGLTALDIAIQKLDTKSAQVLVEAGSPLPSVSGLLRLTTKWHESINDPQGTRKYTITRIILDKLVWRRNQLRTFAFDHLTPALKKHFGMTRPGLLDSKAAQLVAHLRRTGLYFPPSLAPGQGFDDMTAVYLACGEKHATEQLMEQLWERGFQDVACITVDSIGNETVLLDHVFVHRGPRWHTENQIKIAAWLIGHGALTPCSNLRQGQILLAMAERLEGFPCEASIGEWSGALDGLSVCPEFSLAFFAREHQDTCECLCSFDGCSTISKYWATPVDTGVKLKVVELLLGARKSSLEKKTAPRLIRSCVFNFLEMRHTCCEFPGNTAALLRARKARIVGLDAEGRSFASQPSITSSSHHVNLRTAEEILQIDQEQSDRVEVLEELVTEVMHAFRGSELGIFDFMRQSFSPLVNAAHDRMMQVRFGSGSNGEDEQSADEGQLNTESVADD